MSKFRPINAPSPMTKEHFSVGSIFYLSKNERFLVVADNSISSVFLVSLETFTRTKNAAVKVLDINWITEEEARAICNLANTNAAFSDFDFNEKGLKN